MVFRYCSLKTNTILHIKPTRSMPRYLVLISLLAMAMAGCTGPRVISSSDTTEDADDERFKKYSDVITSDAETDDGLFTVHRVREKLFYEIPDSALTKEMLLVSRIARTHTDIGYGGEKANSQVVRWERQGDDILLRLVSYESVASEDHPIYEAVRNANFEPIIASMDVEARNADSSASVIDVTSLFTKDVDVLGLQNSRRETFKVKSLDEDRSFINWAKSFPTNVEVRHTLTYEADEPPANESSSTISLEMNQSMVLLPADKMKPRACDERVGYFNVEMVDYGADTQKATEKCYVTRWRLEPKDPEAFARGELVEPVKPIVYYIDPATPTKWRPYIKQGVDDWSEAFEAAGFKNAIMAKDPPTPEEDPEFSPEDARYSVIRYFPSDVQNAYGPHEHDPRTGEILESDIGWFHNVMNLLRNWYFIQTAAVNPEARGVQFEDEVMGELIRFVSAHEVGHTLGLPHNWGSSYAYPVDSLRSPTFTATHGTAPSIMDYARFNYIAQPEDGVTRFLPAIGEYDEWAIMWGYRPIPDAVTPEEERAILNEWVSDRADDPAYFYGRQTGSRIDPRSQNEDLGDDAVLASEYGIANLKRIVPQLASWTYQEGENYDDLAELYQQVVGQWNRYMGHVASNVGGVYETYKRQGQNGPVYQSVPESAQRRAIGFLNEFAFERPDWLLEEDILRRIEHAGALERIRNVQVGVLGTLLNAQRMARLIEAETIAAGDSYTPVEMLSDLRSGVWAEIYDGEAIGPIRRNLQRGYIEQMQELMTEEVTPPPARVRQYMGFTPVDVSQSDIRPLVRGELETLKSEIDSALRRTDDRATELHLRDVVARIDEILDPED